VNDTKYQVKTPDFEFFRRRLRLKIDDKAPMFRFQYEGNFIRTSYCGVVRTCEIYTPAEWRLAPFMPRVKEKGAENVLVCPMPGLVVTILAKAGERVFRGQDLVNIESMKMESFVASPTDGEVDRIVVRSGQAVETGDVLLTFK
jgi:propionyl-CoA carboxylase alpha chain